MSLVEREEFISCVRQLFAEPKMQKIETQNFIMMKPNGIITVKFKSIKGLTGYFMREELESPESINAILSTLEREIERKEGEKR